MGGYGSGMYHCDTKKCVEDCVRMNVGDIKEFLNAEQYDSGTLTWGKNTIGFNYYPDTDDRHFVLQYYIGDTPYSATIPIVYTVPNYGGKRWWFTCPECLRSVASLYFIREHFECRDCSKLTYRSRNLPKHERLLRKARDISYRLGGDGDVYFLPKKPIGMRSNKYERYREAFYECVRKMDEAFMMRY